MRLEALCAAGEVSSHSVAVQPSEAWFTFKARRPIRVLARPRADSNRMFPEITFWFWIGFGRIQVVTKCKYVIDFLWVAPGL